VIVHPSTGLPVLSFHEMAEDARRFRRLLSHLSIKIPADGDLDSALSRIESLPDLDAPADESDPARVRDAFPRAIGLHYLVRLLLQIQNSPTFASFVPRLRHLVTAGGNSAFTVKSQASQARNFSFEILMGALAEKTGFQVSFTEPDLGLVDGERWAVACKTVNTDSPVTFADRVEEGIGQCLGVDSDYALVIVGLSNRLAHDPFLPLLDKDEDIWGSFFNADQPAELLRQAMTAAEKLLLEAAVVRFIKGRESKTFRGILLHVQTVAGIMGKGACCTFSHLVDRQKLFGEPRLEGLPEARIARRLHDAAQRVLQ